MTCKGFAFDNKFFVLEVCHNDQLLRLIKMSIILTVKYYHYKDPYKIIIRLQYYAHSWF